MPEQLRRQVLITSNLERMTLELSRQVFHYHDFSVLHIYIRWKLNVYDTRERCLQTNVA